MHHGVVHEAHGAELVCGVVVVVVMMVVVHIRAVHCRHSALRMQCHPVVVVVVVRVVVMMMVVTYTTMVHVVVVHGRPMLQL